MRKSPNQTVTATPETPRASIWSKQILSPSEVRSPSAVLEDAVEQLSDADTPYQAQISRKRRGENDSSGLPTSRRDLFLIDPSKGSRRVATVEYPESGYPAKLILGDKEVIYLSVASEEELVGELTDFIASLDLS